MLNSTEHEFFFLLINVKMPTIVSILTFMIGKKSIIGLPVIFIADRPKAALLLWFFGDFRCGALLFVVIHVIYKYKNR